MLVVTSEDDPITKYKSVPVFDIKRNPNMILAVLPNGGHCEFSYRKRDAVTGKTYYSNYMEEIAFEYFAKVKEYDELDNGLNTAT